MASLSASIQRDLDRWAEPRAPRDGCESEFAERGDYREILIESPIALVEDSSVSPHRPPPSGHSEHHQLVLPYLGLFEFKVAGSTALVDANSALYVTGGQDFADRHPVRNVGHAGVVITPSKAVLDELATARECRPTRRSRSPPCRCRPALPCSPSSCCG